MYPILCLSCSRHLAAEPDGTFTCDYGHVRHPESLDLGADQIWLVDENGTLVRIPTPAASLRRMLEADREYCDAPPDYEQELPPLLDLREAAFDFATAMALGMPYPAEVL
ncbi:hypothetical protein [Streptomyces sp. NPDC006134]|uniref:hypothetical protein n=1 Tax=Streptomyces sp. NPDC006134 TaxID=3154467 RepID=UPI0034114913